MNFVDPEVASKLPSPSDDPNLSSSSGGVRVPFTASTTHHNSFVDHTAHYPAMRVQSKASVLFGMESAPHENIWTQPWDDNSYDPEELQQQQQQ